MRYGVPWFRAVRSSQLKKLFKGKWDVTIRACHFSLSTRRMLGHLPLSHPTYTADMVSGTLPCLHFLILFFHLPPPRTLLLPLFLLLLPVPSSLPFSNPPLPLWTVYGMVQLTDTRYAKNGLDPYQSSHGPA